MLPLIVLVHENAVAVKHTTKCVVHVLMPGCFQAKGSATQHTQTLGTHTVARAESSVVGDVDLCGMEACAKLADGGQKEEGGVYVKVITGNVFAF